MLRPMIVPGDLALVAYTAFPAVPLVGTVALPRWQPRPLGQFSGQEPKLGQIADSGRSTVPWLDLRQLMHVQETVSCRIFACRRRGGLQRVRATSRHHDEPNDISFG